MRHPAAKKAWTQHELNKRGLNAEVVAKSFERSFQITPEKLDETLADMKFKRQKEGIALHSNGLGQIEQILGLENHLTPEQAEHVSTILQQLFNSVFEAAALMRQEAFNDLLLKQVQNLEHTTAGHPARST